MGGNNYSSMLTSSARPSYQRPNHTIEIIMADEIEDANNDKSHNISGIAQIANQTVDYQRVDLNKSNHSLSSIMSITSSTQTEPDLFTEWPSNKRFIFSWLNRLKNYQQLLSKSHQYIHTTASIFHSNVLSKRNLQVRYISLSTQTINRFSDYQLMPSVKSKTNTKLMQLKVPLMHSNEEQLEINNCLENESNLEIEECHAQVENIQTEIENGEEVKEVNRDFIEAESSSALSIEDRHPIIEKSRSPIKKRQKLMSHETLVSNLTNRYFKNEYKANEHCKSSDSLTSITWLSKPDNTSLIFKSNGKAYRHRLNKTRKIKKKAPHGSDLTEFVCKAGLKKYSNSTAQDMTFSRTETKSLVKLKINNNSKLRGYESEFDEDDNDDEFNKTKSNFEIDNKISILSYRFWINSCNKNWNIFHNSVDRRIESIGRLSKCRIQLTNAIMRQSNGLLKQRVNVYAPSHSAMEKCCKLFDDKFPEFYASSGLLRILYYRRGSFAVNNLLRNGRSNDLPVNLPVVNYNNAASVGATNGGVKSINRNQYIGHRNDHQKRRKRKSTIVRNSATNSNNNYSELGFIKNQLLNL